MPCCMCGATDCRSCGPAQGVPWCYVHKQSAQYCEETRFDEAAEADERAFDEESVANYYNIKYGREFD